MDSSAQGGLGPDASTVGDNKVALRLADSLRE